MYNTNTKDLLKLDKYKKDRLRYNEYYNMQHIFDNLYKQSLEGSKFSKLYDLICSDENILLAYRTLKSNRGSKTPGTNRHTIEYWENKSVDSFLCYIKSRLNNYMPQKVRRVEIPKSNGKMRPLGIPCIEDRLIQQCIKQVLEPICEAKFHPHSYGFRPNRSTQHAIAYVYHKINQDNVYYMVDIDIKSFFDNVNHSKLLKQLWTLGIRDKKLLSIINAMLKAEVEGIGIPTKGVPQGGILSPLLSNIVLNELDWWISSQWQTYNSHYKYKQNSHKFRAMRKTKLKEMYIVRYADDFKLMCKSADHANRAFIATQQWLKERLDLEISAEKSKIVDVRKSASEYLGLKIKAQKKKHKYVASSRLTKKAKDKVKSNIKNQIIRVQKCTTDIEIYKLNRIIAGSHNYYRIATNVFSDFRQIHYNLLKCIKNRLRIRFSKTGNKTMEYIKNYGHYTGKEYYINGAILYPIKGVKTKIAKCFNQYINNYTEEGRKTLHTNLGYIQTTMLNYLSNNPIPNRSVEYNDNRLSIYSAQKGMCSITGSPLHRDMELHHIIPLSKDGSDHYSNLILLSSEVHALIHAIHKDTIERYINTLNLNDKSIKKINKYRKIIGYELI
ncbi:group II intron reverse transcriptase/maturase [Clostridioides difficile]|uniref:group II intron reverse transcriptase/maturase n=1 Tax=Clostridioides difficile TaxID=1496 RepID=UPI000F61EA38|nr:group II intron reverse transcriptase/maturase [Clostridioides difficile]RRH01413.1 group II intron reverse transcriptase/maturase [Clostridioides difficile]